MTKEALVEMIANMAENQQNLFYEGLKNNGLSENDIITIKSMVTFWKMENVPGFKAKVMDAIGRRAYAELRA